MELAFTSGTPRVSTSAPELFVINLVPQHAKQPQQEFAGHSNGCYRPVPFQRELVVKPSQIRITFGSHRTASSFDQQKTQQAVPLL